MPFFSKVFKNKDSTNRTAAPLTNGHTKEKPQWSDAWLRTRVDPEEVAELLHFSTTELKSRGLDVPLLILPFRPSSDPSAARTFVRNYFFPPHDREQLRDAALASELKMTEVMVIISVMKWCWARLPGGVVSWDVYELFKVGERDSGHARDAFTSFLPLSTDSSARVSIIRDFFDLLAAIAAHAKTNGLGGYKLSRYAGWWAFEHYDTGKGFDAGYQSWARAADATCHLFFAYLRSLSPENGKSKGILGLPRSLQQLLASVDYPPQRALVSNDTTKIVMIVDGVSPTPYALLRRTKNFEYRDDDRALQQFSTFEDPIQALTDECRRVLKAISSTNQSQISNAETSTSLTDPSWSRFEDIGFGSTLDEIGEHGGIFGKSSSVPRSSTQNSKIDDLNRPTTPSWADFLSSGFDENGHKINTPVFLPHDKILPVIGDNERMQNSQSRRGEPDNQSNLVPGEIASITRIRVDDAFWWVWITSLAGEEPTSRKAAFGRCALIETVLTDAKWMVMEEQVKGAAPEPVAGAYIAEKKGFLGFSKRGRLTRRRSQAKKNAFSAEANDLTALTRTNIAPDQAARIQQKAAEISRQKQAEEAAARQPERVDQNHMLTNRNSTFTLGPLIKDEASPALKWASQYDKKEVRAKYLGDTLAGKGSKEMLTLPTNGADLNQSTSSFSSTGREVREFSKPPQEPTAFHQTTQMTALPDIGPDYRTIPTSVPASHPAQIMRPESSPRPPSVPSKSPPPPETKRSPFTFKSANASEPKRAISPTPRMPDRPLHSAFNSPEDNKSREVSHGPSPVLKSTGIRRLFGTKKGRSPELPVPKTPDSPVETNPAIIAARRALEGKPAPPIEEVESPPYNITHFAKVNDSNHPVEAVQTIVETPPVRAVTPPPQPVTPPSKRAASPVLEESQALVETSPSGRPKTRRDEEYDQLSRVDTNEREHADREFSRFDQGPLLDQPAFVPEETPPRGSPPSVVSEEPSFRPAHLSVYSAVTVPEDDDEEEEVKEDLTLQPSPQDRWAQIRKNAAERAARHSEEQTTRSRTETRTDDGDTSGEETIESRVARIKARVAELTGNMEAIRRQ